MDTVSDLPISVVSFFRDDVANPAEKEPGFLSAVDAIDEGKRGILPKDEISSLGDTAARTVSKLRQMAATPEGRETLSFALDGLIGSERTPEQQRIVTEILEELTDAGADVSSGRDAFRAPDQVVGRSIDFVVSGSDEPIESVFVPPSNRWPDGLIIVLDTTGFREAQIAIQDQTATALAHFSESQGLDLGPGDAGIRIARAMRGEPDALAGLDTTLLASDLIVDGEAVQGLARI